MVNILPRLAILTKQLVFRAEWDVDFIMELSQALDYLAIGIHELANISERRMEKLINSGISLNIKYNIHDEHT